MSGGCFYLAACVWSFRGTLGLGDYIFLRVPSVVASSLFGGCQIDVYRSYTYRDFLHLVGFSVLYHWLLCGVDLDKTAKEIRVALNPLPIPQCVPKLEKGLYQKKQMRAFRFLFLLSFDTTPCSVVTEEFTHSPMRTNSILRFFSLPSLVSFEAIGLASPYPMALSLSKAMPFFTR